ncbi:MAG: acyl-CoA desaturase, partial [Planctomycetota bacterium]
TVGFGFLWLHLGILAIGAGYHRRFAHGAYRARAPLRFLYLVFGAAAVQNSALKWSSDHRLHHSATDGDRDPYNIQKGFWWAHVGWVLHQDVEGTDSDRVKDIASDPLVRWQERHYVKIALVMALLVPAAIGSLWGDALGAVLVAGFLRLVVQWHCTFSINSIAHLIGKQPYCTKTSARDSIWTALVSLGEGYHNFHHRFQTDYRNGVRWFHFDPTKWFVWTMSKLKLASDLRRVPRQVIEQARRSVKMGEA